MNYFAISIAIVAFSVGGAAQQTKPATAPSLDGTWMVTSINGEEAAAGSPELTLTIKGDKYHQALGGEVNERGTIKVDAAKKPMTIDLAISEGPDAGKTQLGIVEVTGDTMRLNLDTPGAGQRPADFTAKGGFILIVGKKKASRLASAFEQRVT
jgi:uncharacterized protein (TIGR03067 family)